MIYLYITIIFQYFFFFPDASNFTISLRFDEESDIAMTVERPLPLDPTPYQHAVYFQWNGYILIIW